MSQFKCVEDGIFIGPQPSEQNLDDAKQQGIKTAIDFRMPAGVGASRLALGVVDQTKRAASTPTS